MNLVAGNKQKAWIAYFAIGALLLIVPFLVDWGLGRFWLRIIDFALLYAMLALGLNIVVGFAGLLDLGYVAFYAVGAYLYAILASPHFGIHLPFWVLLPLGATLAGIFGILLGAPTLKLRGDYLAIVTLGFGEIVRIFMNNLDRPINITNGPQGINLVDPIRFGEFSLTRKHEIFGVMFTDLHQYYYLFLLLTLAVIFICMRLQDSRIGRAWVAIREDETAAEAMGINTRNIKLLAFAMGATFGGIAGGLFASMQAFVSPESFTLNESITVLCMVVLGGMGHIPGVVLGAILLTALPEALRYTGALQQSMFHKVYIDPANLRMLLFGVVMVATMLFRPEGLWRSPQRQRELTDREA